MSSILCIMGPTASGKTALAIQLCQIFPCNIISVDSSMVYRGMDIGTAKPTPEELAIAPHRLIDICDPSENYSAGQFVRDALVEIEATIQQQRVPLLVGGTMLYFRALQQGLAELPEKDLAVRKKIAERAAEEGWEALHRQLMHLDPALGKHIHVNDKQRIARALEIHALTQRKPSEIFADKAKAPLPYRLINVIVANNDRVELREKIKTRFYKMLRNGFIEEVEKLFTRGDLNADLPAMRAVGYRQIWAYLAGALTYEEMCDRSIIATCQLAKRQMTWLRSWQNATWFNSNESQLLEKMRNFLDPLDIQRR